MIVFTKKWRSDHSCHGVPLFCGAWTTRAIRHYTPFGKPQPGRPRDPGEVLWMFRREGVDWSCELVVRGENYGWEGRVLRSGDLVISHRFVVRGQAVEWSQTQQVDIKRGWIDG